MATDDLANLADLDATTWSIVEELVGEWAASTEATEPTYEVTTITTATTTR